LLSAIWEDWGALQRSCTGGKRVGGNGKGQWHRGRTPQRAKNGSNDAERKRVTLRSREGTEVAGKELPKTSDLAAVNQKKNGRDRFSTASQQKKKKRKTHADPWKNDKGGRGFSRDENRKTPSFKECGGGEWGVSSFKQIQGGGKNTREHRKRKALSVLEGNRGEDRGG